MLLNFFKEKKKKEQTKKVDIRYSKPLPPEIVRLIVLYLKNDKKSLHSCLLVSRNWCRETVDLLWKQPFHFLYTCNKINSSVTSQSIRKSKLYNQQYCCSNEKRQYQATNLLMTYLLIKHDKEFVEEGIIKAESERITFNYFEFLFVLDLHELYYAVKDWNRWNMPISKFNRDNPLPLKFESIIRYFIMNTSKLQVLSLDTEFILYEFNNKNPCSFLIDVKVNKYDNNNEYFSYRDNYILKLLIKESKSIQFFQFFDNLTELILTIKENKYEIFLFLSQICHNIQKLITKTDYRNSTCESNSLISLIRTQHNLVHFEIFDVPEMYINEILESLKYSQHNSLRTLILNNVRIIYNSTILSYLKYLQNLQELRFNNCICRRNLFFDNEYNKKDIFDEEKNYEEGLWLPNLKYLQVNFIDENEEEFNELSFILSSILIRCSPLIISNI
ncbi:hypothetical protein RhiirA4_451656 [Rhizophagus irregularis]|uniref:F-box domain-containing protein n=1 Tax=Rhizophagus irregularis TaxID=588596 RepID=A0A2I1FWA6_9GLOM|nr:hypothetical protein RhiirA4_451656 [Rhizophagus irregularis]